jgi:hypothetical protein
MKKLPFYLAGGGAGVFTSFLDLLKDPNQGTIARVGAMLRENLLAGVNLFFAPAFWAIVLIVIASLFVCWVFEVTSRMDGFLRGCSVLAAFSIGAPSPIINKQVGDLDSGVAAARHVGDLSLAVGSAWALEETKPRTSNGEVYIVLDHLKTMNPRPDSTVTVRNGTSQAAISIFRIPDNVARIFEPYGTYTVDVATPGFANIRFDLKIDQLLAAYSVSAQTSAIPLPIQKLITPTKVELTPNDAEKYKQLGRKRRLVDDFEGAVANYQQSLALEPNDGLTHDYLGYAFFRLRKYEEAVREFQIAIVQRPDYKWSSVNLIKVDCAQRKYGEARQKLDQLRQVTNIWQSDGEFRQLCAEIVNE